MNKLEHMTEDHNSMEVSKCQVFIFVQLFTKGIQWFSMRKCCAEEQAALRASDLRFQAVTGGGPGKRAVE